MTKIKAIVSIILMILLSFLMSYISVEYWCYTTIPECIAGEPCLEFTNPCNIWNPELLILNFVVFGGATLILTYLIYSLFEKKK